MAGEAFDLVYVMRCNQNRDAFGIGQKTFDQFVARERIERAEGLVHDDQTRPVGERRCEQEFHAHASGQVPQLPIARQIEFMQQPLGVSLIPVRIERP